MKARHARPRVHVHARHARPREHHTRKAVAVTALGTGLSVAGAGVADAYVVKPGDTLSKIARSNGVASWKPIFTLNKGVIRNPNLIFPGQVLRLPTKGRAVKPARRAVTRPATLTGAWRLVAMCESGLNPRALNPGGKYRGLFQFDLPTWRSVGGSGDPAAASVAEQLKRAKLLFAARGAQPWPSCGRFL